MLNNLDNFFDLTKTFLNCSKFNGCKGSTAEFFGSGCISIISPSQPAAMEAKVKLGTQGAQKDAWLGSLITGKLDISFNAGIA